jgi:hypothetical protein
LLTVSFTADRGATRFPGRGFCEITRPPRFTFAEIALVIAPIEQRAGGAFVSCCQPGAGFEPAASGL